MKTLVRFVALFAISFACLAQEVYPNRPIRLVVPYPPGGVGDAVARMIAPGWSAALKQPIVIENRGGAGSNIGLDAVAKSAPDGYTIALFDTALATNPALYPSMPFDPEKDFEAVALVSTFPMVILANPNAPYKNMADLLADAKARPDVVNVGLPSTTSRLVLELIQKQSGIVMRSVPYKGSGTSMTDLMGGQVLVAIDTASAARPFVASGKLKALAVTSLKDSALLPGTPPAAGEGLEGFQVVAWNGLYAPRGTPAAIVQKLNAEIAKILALPEARQRLLELGHEAAGGTPDSLARFARTERDKWGPLVKSAGMKLE